MNILEYVFFGEMNLLGYIFFGAIIMLLISQMIVITEAICVSILLRTEKKKLTLMIIKKWGQKFPGEDDK